MKNILNDFKTKTNILDEKDIDYFKKHKLFKELNLTDHEIRKNALILSNIIIQEERCLENPKECFLNTRYHYNFIRDDSNRLKLICSGYCTNFKKYYDENKYKMNMLYNTYHDTKISNVELSKKYFKNVGTSSIQNAINKYYEIWNNNKVTGLYLYGDFGVGKTYLSMAFANDVIKNKNKTVCFITLTDLISKIKSTFNSIIFEKKEEIDNLIYKIKSCDVLFIDDLGSEYAAEWFYNEYFLNILNDRNSNEKITFFNSNYSLKELSNLFHSKMGSGKFIKKDAERIVSRIKSLCNNDNIHIINKNLRYLENG